MADEFKVKTVRLTVDVVHNEDLASRTSEVEVVKILTRAIAGAALQLQAKFQVSDTLVDGDSVADAEAKAAKDAEKAEKSK